MPLWLKEYCTGLMMGIVDLIPGVSGVTVLFLLGLYERVIGAISKFKAGSAALLTRYGLGVLFSRQRKENFTALTKEARALDLPFLIRLLLGAGTTILLFSTLIKYLLENQFTNLYGFFFGLIIVSIFLSIKMLKIKKPHFLFHFALGALITVTLTMSGDPVQDAIKKSERYRIINEAVESGQTSLTVRAPFKYSGHYTGKELIETALTGSVVVCVAILPGISGSLVMVLIGKYYDVISAVSGLKTLQLDYMLFCGLFGLGMLFGAVIFARVINFVFSRFYNATISFVVGLLAGSLYALWPFKQTVVMDQYVRGQHGISLVENAVVHTNINALPPDTASLVFALAFCCAGAAFIILLERFAGQKKIVGT
ncbi:MAG: DUF368 domain-containing protein [Chitinispirillales bacterium]|jgi:putative membrane protein|nr:DUF368 domain-containing protein [Chitinispirillales bacterium]